MRDYAVTAVLILALPFMVAWAHVGVYFWAWLSYMNPHKQAWGFAQHMPFAQWTALATLVGLLLSREPKRIPWTRETVLLVAFICWMGLTTVFAFNQAGAQEQLVKVVKIQVMTFVTLMVITTRERMNTLLWVVALSIGYYGIKGGIFTITTGGGFRVMGPAETFIGGNNEIALALATTIPIFRYFQLQARPVWLRTLLGIAIFLCFVAAVGSQSRGAFIALAAMGVMLIMKSRRRALLSGLGVVCAGFVVLFMPETWWDRMRSISDYGEDRSAQGRINAWWFAVNLARANFFGGGFETFTSWLFNIYSPDPTLFVDAHSIYFEVMAEHGFVGLGLFLSLFVSAWFTAAHVARDAKRDAKLAWMSDLMQMIQVSLVAYAFGGLFLGLAYWDLPYHLVAIVVLCRQLLRSEESQVLPVKREGPLLRYGVRRDAGGSREPELIASRGASVARSRREGGEASSLP